MAILRYNTTLIKDLEGVCEFWFNKLKQQTYEKAVENVGYSQLAPHLFSAFILASTKHKGPMSTQHSVQL